MSDQTYIGADRGDQDDNPDYDETATVELDLSIQINTRGVVETSYTVKEWNALTPGQRFKEITELWQDEASSNDKGGVKIVTPGAKQD